MFGRSIYGTPSLHHVGIQALHDRPFLTVPSPADQGRLHLPKVQIKTLLPSALPHPCGTLDLPLCATHPVSEETRQYVQGCFACLSNHPRGVQESNACPEEQCINSITLRPCSQSCPLLAGATWTPGQIQLWLLTSLGLSPSVPGLYSPIIPSFTRIHTKEVPILAAIAQGC